MKRFDWMINMFGIDLTALALALAVLIIGGVVLVRQAGKNNSSGNGQDLAELRGQLSQISGQSNELQRLIIFYSLICQLTCRTTNA